MSNTAYCQIALCEKLAKDLDLDLDQLIASLPKRRGAANVLFDPRGIDTPVTGPKPEGERNSTRISIGRYGMGSGGGEVR